MREPGARIPIATSGCDVGSAVIATNLYELGAAEDRRRGSRESNPQPLGQQGSAASESTELREGSGTTGGTKNVQSAVDGLAEAIRGILALPHEQVSKAMRRELRELERSVDTWRALLAIEARRS